MSVPPAIEQYRTSEWPLTEEEYALAHFGFVAVALLIALLLDSGCARVASFLNSPAVDDLSKGQAFEQQLGLLLRTRMQGKVAVFGSLSLLIWLSSRSGALGALAEVGKKWPRPTDTPLETPEQAQQRGACSPRIPPDAGAMLQLATDAHFSIVLTVVGYFCLLHLVNATLLVRLSGYKRLERGGPPRNPAEHFAARQLDAMRTQLLNAANSEARCKAKLAKRSPSPNPDPDPDPDPDPGTHPG